MNFQLRNALKSLLRKLKDEHFFLVDDNIEWVLLALIMVHILLNNGCMINKCLFSSIIVFFGYACFCRGRNGSQNLLTNLRSMCLLGFTFQYTMLFVELWYDLSYTSPLFVFKVNREP